MFARSTPLSPEQEALHADVIASLGAPRYVTRREETIARATFEAEEDAPIVRVCNLCLLAMRDRTMTHLRVTLEKIEVRVAGAWQEALTLNPPVRAWAHEEMIWRFKQMSGLDAGPPRGSHVSTGTLKLIYRAEPEESMDLAVCFVLTPAPVIVLAMLPAEDPLDLPWQLSDEADRQIDLGELDAAAESLARAAVEGSARFGTSFVLPDIRRGRGRLLAARGELGAALAELSDIYARARALGDDRIVCNVSLDLGVLARLRGELPLAATYLRQAFTMTEEEAWPLFAAEAQLELARVLFLQGQHARGVALLERAMELAHRGDANAEPVRRGVMEELAKHRSGSAPYR